MQITKGVTVACLSLLMGLSASSWARDTWYIGGNSYETTFNNNSVKDRERVTNCGPLVCNTTVVERNYRGRFDTDRHPSIQFGFLSRDGWRSEFEYTEADWGIKSPQSKESSIESRRFMASFWRDFRRGDSPLGTYAGLGIGVGELTQGSADDEFIMAQAGVGVTFAVTRQLTLDLGYRLYAAEPDIVLEDSDRAIDLDYRGHSYNLGLRYYIY